MNSELYDEKRRELNAEGPVFVSFAVSASLIATAILLAQIVL